MGIMDDLLARADSATPDWFGASLTLSADTSYNTPRTPWTQSSTAVDVMTPTNAGAGLGEWGDFFKDTAKALVGYAIAKDASRSGVAPNAGQTSTRNPAAPGQVVMQPSYQPQPANVGGLMPLLIIGGLVYLAVRG